MYCVPTVVESCVNEEIIVEVFVRHSPGLLVPREKEKKNQINSTLTSVPLIYSRYKLKPILYIPIRALIYL